MSTINYSIRSKVKGIPVPIYLRVRHKEADVKCVTPFFVNPEYWDKGKIKSSIVFMSLSREQAEKQMQVLRDLSDTLDDIERDLWVHINNEDSISLNVVQYIIEDVRTKKAAIESKMTLNKYLSQFIEDIESGERLNKGVKFKDGTVSSWKSFQKAWLTFQAENKMKVDFNDINERLYTKFINFMNSTLVKPATKKAPAQYGYRQNTKAKNIKHLKAIMNYAINDGYTKNLEHKKKSFAKTPVDVETIYLTKREIRKIYDFQPTSETMEKCKDIFLIGCYIGQRVSDYNSLTPDNVIRLSSGIRAIKLVQHKTGRTVFIPVLYPELDALIDKYKDGFPKINEVEINEQIKEIGKACCINDLITVSEVIGDQIVKSKKLKWQLITTHTARRSCVTNLYKERKLDKQAIMSISGHETEKSFNKYLKITPTEMAEHIAKLYGIEVNETSNVS